MKKLKQFEVVIKNQAYLSWEDLKKIESKDFEIKVKHNPPVPITTDKKAFGAPKDGIVTVVAYRPPIEPFQIYIIIEEEELD